MAINPDMFEPGFQDRMQELIDICRSTPLVGIQDGYRYRFLHNTGKSAVVNV